MEHSSGRAGRILQGNPQPFSQRGGGKHRYLHRNWIWDYRVKDPANELVETVLRHESNKQLVLDI